MAQDAAVHVRRPPGLRGGTETRRQEELDRRTPGGVPPACPGWRRSTGSCGAPWRRSWSPPSTGTRTPEPALRALEQHNLALQRERAELLVGAGYPYDYIDEKVQCQLCQDRGFLRDGSPLPVPHGLLHPGAEPAAEQAAGPGGPVLRHLLLRLVQRRRLAGVRPQPPGEHGDDPGDLRATTPTPSAPAAGTCCSPALRGWGRPSSPPASPGRSATWASPWSTIPPPTCSTSSRARSSARRTPTRRTRTGRSTATSTATC